MLVGSDHEYLKTLLQPSATLANLPASGVFLRGLAQLWRGVVVKMLTPLLDSMLDLQHMIGHLDLKPHAGRA